MKFSHVVGVIALSLSWTSVVDAFVMSNLASKNSVLSSTLLLATTDNPRTLYDKIWDDHLVDDDGMSTLLYVDRHLVHEVTSPQAFEGLRLANRGVRRPDCTLVTVDHNVPTEDRSQLIDVQTFIEETASRTQVMQLDQNVADFGLKYFGMADERQGIVHIIGPEQGFTLPGCVTVCGDSHTATHGAFGALAFGIGTSEVEHVLATQTLPQTKTKNMLIRIDGELSDGVTSKDIILHIIGVIGTAGGTGYTIEFAGSAIESLSMEARMSISNMAIEAGARAGIIAPDEITYEYLKGRPMCPTGQVWEDAVQYWESLKSDEGADYDKTLIIPATDIVPTVTWGTSPQDVAPITGNVPLLKDAPSAARKASMQRSLEYIGLEEGQKLEGVPIEKVFIGSCTNGRIEDLRNVAAIAMGRKVANGVHAMVVPGSGLVKKQAEEEGLDKILLEAGFDWREPGCSMCLAMNADKLKPQQRCASTSNRNFEGRQGNGGRTHLMSPAMAAAAAIAGGLADVRNYPFLGDPNIDPRIPSKESSSRAFSTEAFLNPGPVISPQPPYLVAGKTNTAGSAAGLPKFESLTGVAAPMDIQNVDTDMIIPKEFLKTIKRSGLGFAAFAELRYENPQEVATIGEEVAKMRPDFVLNRDGYRDKAKILITGDNFGCGSSREHAPWAINDMGIRCIISTSFADIFYNNCFNNGMLPVTLPREQVEVLLQDASSPDNEMIVDLVNQKVVRSNGESFSFEIDEFRKRCLVLGLDKIGLTLEKVDKISEFEKDRSQKFPWLDGAAFQVPDVVRMYPDAGYWEKKDTDVVGYDYTSVQRSVSSTQLNAMVDGRTVEGAVVPTNNFILVKIADAIEETQGGILLTGKAKIKKTEGTVMSVGPGKTHPETGAVFDMPVTPGESVVYGKYDGTEIDIDGAKHTLIRDDDILIKFTGDKLTLDSVDVIRDAVLVEVETKKERQTEGGILIAKSSSSQIKPSTGKVVKVGPGRLATNGEIMGMEVSPGDYIKFRDYAGNEVEIDGEEYTVVRMLDVLAKF